MLTYCFETLFRRNNHIRKLRADLVDAAHALSPEHRVRLIALVWPIDSPSLPRDKLHELCAARIVARGQNHQTLRAGEGHEQAIWSFFGQHEKFDPAVNKEDGAFDETVEVDPAWTKREALEHVVDRLVPIFGLKRPTPEELEEAISFADAYRPQVFKELTLEAKAKAEERKKPRYYGVLVEQDLKALLAPLFPESASALPEPYATLLAKDRINKSPHVTLVHEMELKSPDEAFRAARQATWDQYVQLVRDAKTHGSDSLVVELALGPRIVWDDRVMSIEVSGMRSEAGTEMGLGTLVGRSLHVTVGTREEDVRPIEGKLVLEAVEKGETTTREGGIIHVREMEVVQCRGRLTGLR